MSTLIPYTQKLELIREFIPTPLEILAIFAR